jgi:hypothetical protein
MKRVATIAIAVIVILTGVGVYWLRTRATKTATVDAETGSSKTQTTTSFYFKQDGAEFDWNGKKTVIDFVIPDGQNVEVKRSDHFTFHDGHIFVTFLVTIKAEQPTILTKEAFEKIRHGMTYGDVAAALGGEFTKGRLTENFYGALELAQGKRRIELKFADSKITEKSAKELA